jgi:hypothetical protein
MSQNNIESRLASGEFIGVGAFFVALVSSRILFHRSPRSLWVLADMGRSIRPSIGAKMPALSFDEGKGVDFLMWGINKSGERKRYLMSGAKEGASRAQLGTINAKANVSGDERSRAQTRPEGCRFKAALASRQIKKAPQKPCERKRTQLIGARDCTA